MLWLNICYKTTMVTFAIGFATAPFGLRRELSRTLSAHGRSAKLSRAAKPKGDRPLALRLQFHSTILNKQMLIRAFWPLLRWRRLFDKICLFWYNDMLINFICCITGCIHAPIGFHKMNQYPRKSGKLALKCRIYKLSWLKWVVDC